MGIVERLYLQSGWAARNVPYILQYPVLCVDCVLGFGSVTCRCLWSNFEWQRSFARGCMAPELLGYWNLAHPQQLRRRSPSPPAASRTLGIHLNGSGPC